MIKFLTNLFRRKADQNNRPLPEFTYFPDPVKVGAIANDPGVCECCNEFSDWNCPKGIYAVQNVERICPWCVADGSASKKFNGTFNDLYDFPSSVPKSVMHVLSTRTPGFETWQTNRWLFSDTDAMLFIGEVTGKTLLAEKDQAQIQACLDMEYSPFKNADDLSHIIPGGSPAVYMFRDRETGAYKAYWDCD